MKKILLLLCFATIVKAQNPNFQWAKNFASFPASVTTDTAGNVYTTGTFYGTVDFDPGPGTYTMTCIGTSDVFILKTDVAGNFAWAKQLGGPSSLTYVSNISLDGANNIYINGTFPNQTDFDPGSASYTLTPFGNDDIFILKLNASGNFVWAKQLGGTSGDEAVNMTVDVNGNVYTTGYFYSTADFDPGTGTFTLTQMGNSANIFVSKLDAAGSFMWAKQFGGTIGGSGNDIAIDGTGNVYTTGSFNGIMDFDPGMATFTLAAAGSADVFVTKLDAGGNFVWAKQFGGTNFDAGSGITVDGSGNVFTTGHFSSSGDFDPGTSTLNFTSAGSNDLFISKLDASGTLAWAKQIGGPADDRGADICLDSFGNVYTAGNFQQSVDFDPNAGNFILAAAPSNTNNSNSFISKLDINGNFIWAGSFVELTSTTSSSNDIRSMNINTTNDILVCGDATGTVDFDPSTSVYSVVCTYGFMQKMTNGITGLNEFSVENNNLLVFPNPFTDKLTIDAKENVTIELFNALGQLLISKTTTTASNLINTPQLARGIYYVKVTAESFNKTFKIVKDN